jgi:hypothetical protein
MKIEQTVNFDTQERHMVRKIDVWDFPEDFTENEAKTLGNFIQDCSGSTRRRLNHVFSLLERHKKYWEYRYHRAYHIHKEDSKLPQEERNNALILNPDQAYEVLIESASTAMRNISEVQDLVLKAKTALDRTGVEEVNEKLENIDNLEFTPEDLNYLETGEVSADQT